MPWQSETCRPPRGCAGKVPEGLVTNCLERIGMCYSYTHAALLHDKRAGLRLLGVGAHVMPRCCLGWGGWLDGWMITLLALVHAFDALFCWVGWAGG